MMRKSLRYWPYIVLAIIIMGPMWLPGYILTMDMVFTPHPPVPTEIAASYPFYVLLHYASFLVPMDVLQKILLTGILSAAGIGMHRLLNTTLPKDVSGVALYVGGIFYMVNSFIYERLMMGQFAGVAGYALLPFFVAALINLLVKLEWRQLWRTVGWSLAIMIMSIHTLVPVVIVTAIFVIYALSERLEDNTYIKKLLARIGAGIVASVGISLYWIIPLLQGRNLAAAALNQNGGVEGFASQGGIFSLARLQGFWAEGRGLFLMAQDSALLPGVWQTALWVLIIIGGIVLWRRKRKAAIAAFALLIISLLIALGIIGSGAYREPHKIMVITAMGMAVLLSIGAGWWAQRIHHEWPHRAVMIFALVLPLLATPVMLWGFHGQLHTSMYPQDWYAMNKKLDQINDNRSTIFLPWHLYQRFSFSPRIIAHPAQTFFAPHDVLVSNDPEFAGIASLQADSRKQAISQLLTKQPEDIAEKLIDLGAGYIIFAREPGYENDELIIQKPGIKKIFTSGRLELYKVEVSS